MVKINIGCAGWDYKDWIGPFYPKNLNREEHLSHYAKIFDFIEINNTFYNVPSEKAVQRWYDQVPEDFKFSVKVWQNITHQKENLDNKDFIDLFFSRLRPLEPKLSGYLWQFPPRFKYSPDHTSQLKRALRYIPSESDIFIEFRHNSWFSPDILKQLTIKSSISFVTPYLERVKPYYLPNQAIYYIRLIGDHTLTAFNRVQRDQVDVMDDLHHNLNFLVKQPKIKEIIVIFNNNFRGFAPENVNQLKKSMNLPYQNFNFQKKLLDFL